jgi:hypothetical protein
MPIAQVNQTVADAINALRLALNREYGDDFAFSIMGKGMVLAQLKMNGMNHPVPTVDTDSPPTIVYSYVTTIEGNTLQLFYNPKNALVVLDLISADDSGGNELYRKVISESTLLTHIKPKRK